MSRSVQLNLVAGPYKGRDVALSRLGQLLAIRGLVKSRSARASLTSPLIASAYCPSEKGRSPGDIAAGAVAGCLLLGPFGLLHQHLPRSG